MHKFLIAAALVSATAFPALAANTSASVSVSANASNVAISRPPTPVSVPSNPSRPQTPVSLPSNPSPRR